MKPKFVVVTGLFMILSVAFSCTKDQKAILDCAYKDDPEACERVENSTLLSTEVDSVEVGTNEPAVVE